MSKPETRKLSYYFSSRKQPGENGLPVLSVTMRDGLVRRDKLKRKTDSALTGIEHLLVEPGDIAYNMMRMWQGALGVADRRANVSPAYGVMRPKETVNPGFAAQWFKSDYGLYLLWAYSYGLTDDRLRLYPNEFLQIPVKWPGRPEQDRIAAILDAWDDAISAATSLGVALARRHRGLVGILSSHHNYRREELATFVRKIPKKVTLNSTIPSSIELEDVESKTGRLIGTTSTDELSGQRGVFELGDTLFGKLRPYLQKFYYASQAGVASTEFWVLRPDRKKCRNRFLYYLVQTHGFAAEANRPTGSRMPRADWELVAEAPLPLPELEVQDRLIDVLDASERSAWMQEELIQLLREQKRGLLQKLLTGEVPVPESIDQLIPGAVPEDVFRTPEVV